MTQGLTHPFKDAFNILSLLSDFSLSWICCSYQQKAFKYLYELELYNRKKVYVSLSNSLIVVIAIVSGAMVMVRVYYSSTSAHCDFISTISFIPGIRTPVISGFGGISSPHVRSLVVFFILHFLMLACYRLSRGVGQILTWFCKVVHRQYLLLKNLLPRTDIE